MHVYDALRSTSLEYCYASSLSKKWPVAADVARSVCLSVGHNRQSYTKTAEPNEIRLGYALGWDQGTMY